MIIPRYFRFVNRFFSCLQKIHIFPSSPFYLRFFSRISVIFARSRLSVKNSHVHLYFFIFACYNICKKTNQKNHRGESESQRKFSSLTMRKISATSSVPILKKRALMSSFSKTASLRSKNICIPPRICSLSIS